MKKVQFERGGQLFEFELKPEYFEIDPSNMDHELCTIGRIVLEYGQIEAELKIEVARKKAALEALEARVYRESKLGTEKATMETLKHMVKEDVDRLGGVESYNKSQENYEIMRNAMSALSKKIECLIAMSYRERQLIKTEAYS